jgi:hypothetical protein
MREKQSNQRLIELIIVIIIGVLLGPVESVHIDLTFTQEIPHQRRIALTASSSQCAGTRTLHHSPIRQLMLVEALVPEWAFIHATFAEIFARLLRGIATVIID